MTPTPKLTPAQAGEDGAAWLRKMKRSHWQCTQCVGGMDGEPDGCGGSIGGTCRHCDGFGWIVKPVPITPAQRRVIDNLKAGRSPYWQSKGAGATRALNSCLRLALIESDGSIGGWRLTEKGKSV